MQSLPALGLNLASPSDFASELPFANVGKSSGVWISQEQGQPYGDGPPLSLDSNGNITELQANCSATKPVFTASIQPPAGDYTILWDGTGTIVATEGSDSRIEVVSSEPGQMVVSIPEDCTQWFLNLTATTPGTTDGAPNYLNNLRILMPGITDEANTANPWNPAFLAFWTSRLSCLRFMDWMQTNNSSITSWSQRPVTTLDTYQVAGVPAELLCDLANRLAADPWFCIPHQDDGTTATGLATLVVELLSPSLKAYVEYSNETWNSIFEQNAYVNAQGLAMGFGSGNANHAGDAFTMYSAMAAWSAWQAVLAEYENPPGLVRVMARQASASANAQYTLEFQNGYAETDVLAIAPYITCDVTSGGSGGTTPSEASFDAMTTAEAMLYVYNTALPIAMQWMQESAAVAQQYNLGLVAYEGGQSLVGVGSAQNDATLTALLEACQTDPMMLTVYQVYYSEWVAAGGGLFNYFSSVNIWGKSGSWGIVQYVTDIASNPPKWVATMDWAASLNQPSPAPSPSSLVGAFDLAAADDVQTAIDNLASMLATITANPQPSYSVQGVSMSFNEYKDSIIKNIADLQEVLVMLSGPYQLQTQAVT